MYYVILFPDFEYTFARHAIELMKEIVFEYKDVISNAEFIIDLL